MRIGQDVSIMVCRAEGYMVMDYPVYELRNEPKTTDCRFTKSLPDYARDGFIGEKIIYLDVYLSWNDLWVMYQDNKEGIDSMIGGDYKEDDYKNVSNILNIAGDIDMYCGLD